MLLCTPLVICRQSALWSNQSAALCPTCYLQTDPLKGGPAKPKLFMIVTVCRMLMGLFVAASSLNRKESLLQDLPKHRFIAQVSLKTADFDERHARFAGDDAKPLSNCLMTQNFVIPRALAAAKPLAMSEWRGTGDESRKEKLQKAVAQFENLRHEIEGPDCTIDERSVIIKCRLYVNSWALVCLVLVLGGLALGFSIQGRLSPVDPFNITPFCWALAAFILIVVKSFRVENWPRRDFLRRRCVCRSLSELCAVSRLDPQNVLAYLLHNKTAGILETRGPFNQLFFNKSDNGFFIDVKPELHTLLFSGIVLLKVSTNQGLGVVCLNVRKDTDYVPFVHSRNGAEKEWNLASINYPNTQETTDITLKPTHAGWNRVLGIYNIPARKFR